MSEFAIHCRGLSKQYRAVRGPRYRALRDVLAEAAATPFRRLHSARRAGGAQARRAREKVWALEDVSFEIKHGEVVGVIGRNGAGKSTLLKLLSRVTRPTRGSAVVHGRIGSLLEVGTGFHPELTGRENVYLNGAILGMRRAEIRGKFDEIVDFAGVESFIDTPVKRYSSGMHMRLAFAVAAHLETEVLLLDEVLAVGDSRFRRKCLTKMREVERQGRTVLFVSHDIPAVTRLCPRAILLEGGRVINDGPSHSVASAYLHSCYAASAAREWPDLDGAPGDDVVRLCAVRVRGEDGAVRRAFDIRRPIGVEMEFEVFEGEHVLAPNYRFFNEEGVCAFVAAERGTAWERRPRPAGRHVSTAWIPGNFLAEGTLIVDAALTAPGSEVVHFFERDVVAFQVIDSLDGNSARGDFGGHMPGVVRPLLRWTAEIVSHAPASRAAATKGGAP